MASYAALKFEAYTFSSYGFDGFESAENIHFEKNESWSVKSIVLLTFSIRIS